MILSGPEIARQVELGNIEIDPFDPKNLGPNSYDVHLGNKLLKLETRSMWSDPWDLTKPIPVHDIFPLTIDTAYGAILHKGVAYLANIVERIHCKGFVPWLDGRSTIGRYFLQCHMTAGRGDDGWDGKYTLELISMANAIIIYPGLPIAQLTFFKLEGERKPYEGRYQGQEGPTPPKPLTRE